MLIENCILASFPENEQSYLAKYLVNFLKRTFAIVGHDNTNKRLGHRPRPAINRV